MDQSYIYDQLVNLFHHHLNSIWYPLVFFYLIYPCQTFSKFRTILGLACEDSKYKLFDSETKKRS